MSDRMADLLGFVRGYNDVLAGLAVGARQPLTSDPLLNAYDFRPRSTDAPRPSRATIFKALRSMGFFPDRGQDRGVFLTHRLKQIGEYLRHFTGQDLPEYEISRLVCSYRIYAGLKEGRITRWKLLKT